MDDKPQAAQEFFDRLQQELDAAEDGVLCKLELKFDPAGAGVNVPTLNPLRRDEPVYEQLIEHLRREGCSPGKYRIRMRVGGVIGPQKVEPVQFAQQVAPQVAPLVVPRGAPAQPAVAPGGAASGLQAVAQVVKDYRAFQEELDQLSPEPEDDDDDEEDDEEDDDEPEEEQALPSWLDKAKEEAAKEAIPLAVNLGGALVDLLKAVAKKISADVDAKAGTPPPQSRPQPQTGQAVELVREDDPERAAS